MFFADSKTNLPRPNTHVRSQKILSERGEMMVRLRSGLHQFATAVEKPSERGLSPPSLSRQFIMFFVKRIRDFCTAKGRNFSFPRTDLTWHDIPQITRFLRYKVVRRCWIRIGREKDHLERKHLRPSVVGTRAYRELLFLHSCDNDSKSPLRPDNRKYPKK